MNARSTGRRLPDALSLGSGVVHSIRCPRCGQIEPDVTAGALEVVGGGGVNTLRSGRLSTRVLLVARNIPQENFTRLHRGI